MSRARIARQLSAASARRLAGAPRSFHLVVACCRWPRDEARKVAIRQAAAQGVDWPSALRIAVRHRVTGFLHDGLNHAGVAPPPAIAATLAARARQIALRELRQAQETARLVTLLRDAGVAAIVLKGAPLQALTYRDAGVKQSIDIDLLVAEDCALRAAESLEAAGYRRDPPGEALTAAQQRTLLATSREWVFRRNDRVVELQWRLSYNRRLLQDAQAWPTQTIAIGAGVVETYGNAPLFVYLCVHGAQHSWSRLKWLADANALLAVQMLDAEALYAQAARAGAGRCALQALLLRARLFDAELPASLRARAEAQIGAALLEHIALDALLRGEAAAEHDTRPLHLLRTAVALLLIGDGWAFLGEEIRRYLISPSDVIAAPLPPRLRFLYILLRAPLWLWRRLFPRR
jgi:hypothetical protein